MSDVDQGAVTKEIKLSEIPLDFKNSADNRQWIDAVIEGLERNIKQLKCVKANYAQFFSAMENTSTLFERLLWELDCVSASLENDVLDIVDTQVTERGGTTQTDLADQLAEFDRVMKK